MAFQHGSTLELLHINLLGDPLGSDVIFRWRFRLSKNSSIRIKCDYRDSDFKRTHHSAACRILDDHIIQNLNEKEYRQLIIAVRLPPMIIEGVLSVSAGRAFCAVHSSLRIESGQFDSHVTYNAEIDPIYDRWIREHQSKNDELTRQRYEISKWEKKPLISIVTPVFCTPKAYLQKMIDSILAQTYTNFELVLVNVSGSCSEVDAVIGSYSDSRIRILKAENKDISHNTNIGIAAAQGDYVAFVDHDDFIEVDALYWYVKKIQEHPKVDLLFCAEDLCDEDRYWGARFKPSWNPDLFFSHNYICHMLCVSRWALERTERAGADVAAAQDYDLTFKASEVAREICYVARCLYHWRVHPGSISINRDSKPYAFEAGRKAIQSHFDRLDIPANVVAGSMPLSYKINYLQPPSSVSVIIPSRKCDKELASCVKSVSNLSEDLCQEIIVVSNQELKENGFDKLMQQDKRIRFIYKNTLEVNRFILANSGAREARSESLVILDPSCVPISNNWLSELIAPLARKDIACTGPLILASDGLVAAHGLSCQPDGSMTPAEMGRLPEQPGYMTMLAHCRDVVAVPYCCQAILRDRFLSCGGYREEFGVLAGAELCLRIAVYPDSMVAVEPYSKVQLQSTFLVPETFSTPEERSNLLANHPSIAQGDPYLDPNLRQDGGHFELSDAARDTLAL